MDDVCCVHVVATGEHLEHEILQVVIGQVLSGVNDTVHIGLHQLSNNVDVLIPSGRRWPGDIQNFDYIFVLKEFQKADFSNNTLGIDEILESLWHLLDGNLLV